MMSVGMVAIAGSGAMVKKMGGYVNTKVSKRTIILACTETLTYTTQTHGILGWLAIFCNFGGLYAIYRNKENNGAPHLTSQHAVGGTAVMVSMFLVAIAGGVFLHPDFGIDKRNRTIRIVHKFFSRFVLFLAWVTMISGLWQLLPSSQSFSLVLFGFPLMAFVPFVLI